MTKTQTQTVEELRAEWLREIMLDVFNAENESRKKRKAALFVDIYKDQQELSQKYD